MRAAILSRVGAPLEVDDVTLRPVGRREARVRVVASALCHTDLSLADGTIPQAVPAVLGHEAAGEVLDVGDGVSTLAPGDHVILSWIAPCRRCFWCRGGQVELCEHGFDHAFAGPHGSRGGQPVVAALGTGTFAEETIVPEAAAVVVDHDFPLELAALIGCGAVTGVGAVVHNPVLRPGDSVAVVGCGGVGLAAIQGARLADAGRVIAVDQAPAKERMALDNGATDVVIGAGDVGAAVRDLTGGRGADHTVEAVGLPSTILDAWNACRRGGTVTIVGAGRPDDLVSLPALSLMVDAKMLRGCVYGNTDPTRDFPRMVDWATTGRLDLRRLVTRSIALEDINDAFEAMVRGDVARSVIAMDRA
jgi:S-(hydroxymethyl)glutathione dehydrogenase / alcohol dehydrogenase